MPTLAPGERRALRARAHHLNPVVSIGQQGLTPAVLREIDGALKAHELIKVRVFSDDRAAREALLDEVCRTLDAAPVQHLGKLLVLFRPQPKEAAEAASSTTRAPRGQRHAGTAAGGKRGGPETTAKRGLGRATSGAKHRSAGAEAGTKHRAAGGATAGTKQRAGGRDTTAAKRGAARPPAMPAGGGQARRRRGTGALAPSGVPRAGLPRRRRGP